jgi:heme-degrading monooxygenase HmoA
MAMLVKWIVCEVAASNRARFSLAQEQWAAVAGLEGFAGQSGGWDLKAAAHACIIALWRGPESYQAFMTGEHDAIARKNGQADTYDAIKTSLFEVVWEMPGRASGLPEALRSGGILRTADCTVRPGRRERFLEVQRSLWTPAMSETDGMLGGVFNRLRGADNRYLVATFWKDRAAHEWYVANRLPRLRVEARVEQNVERMEGRVIALEPSWRVIPSPVRSV